jgi:hypothetical protein
MKKGWSLSLGRFLADHCRTRSQCLGTVVQRVPLVNETVRAGLNPLYRNLIMLNSPFAYASLN